MEVGYVMPINAQKEIKANKAYEQVTDDAFATNMEKL